MIKKLVGSAALIWVSKKFLKEPVGAIVNQVASIFDKTIA